MAMDVTNRSISSRGNKAVKYLMTVAQFLQNQYGWYLSFARKVQKQIGRSINEKELLVELSNFLAKSWRSLCFINSLCHSAPACHPAV